MNYKEIVWRVVKDEPTLDAKLTLLTFLAQECDNEGIFVACEDIRTDLTKDCPEIQKEWSELVRRSKKNRLSKDNQRKEKSHEMDDGK